MAERLDHMVVPGEWERFGQHRAHGRDGVKHTDELDCDVSREVVFILGAVVYGSGLAGMAVVRFLGLSVPLLPVDQWSELPERRYIIQGRLTGVDISSMRSAPPLSYL